MIYETILREAQNAAIDACTLNNAMNAIQIAILIALLRWVRSTP